MAQMGRLLIWRAFRYTYDRVNERVRVDGQAVYTFDANGNLLSRDTLTNTFDAANRLVSTTRDGHTVVPIYNGVNDRVGQTVDSVTTDYALDVQGLPEVIYTSDDNAYLHLPGVIVTESATGEVRYLLSDGLGSVRQGVDENAGLVSYQEFDPYGNVVQAGEGVYGFTGEWWQDEIGLLHLRARWYLPGTGTFLSVDPVESEPPYQYVRGNPVNRRDPSGTFPEALIRDSYGDRVADLWMRQDKWWWNRLLEAEHGDALISLDKRRVAQFILDDPLARAYQNIWNFHLPWTECDNPIKTPIKLEGFTNDGRYWSETSPVFAETWRQNTGAFYYTGLHPNDQTWGQFISSQPNLQPYMSENQYPLFWLYYSGLQLELSHVLQHIGTGLDATSVGVSVVQTVAIDTAGILLIGGGCSGGPAGCASGLATAGAVDVSVSAPVGVVDFILGALSLGATAGSDYYGGYTTFADGRVRIGEGTVHTTITLAEGIVPETHVQLYANVKQLLYDFGVDDTIDFGLLEWKALEID